MPKFRKKPVVVEAVRWDGNMDTIEPLLAKSTTRSVCQEFGDPTLIIPTLEGEMRAGVGDWIIRGVRGELYPVKPDIFEATYEPVE